MKGSAEEVEGEEARRQPSSQGVGDASDALGAGVGLGEVSKRAKERLRPPDAELNPAAFDRTIRSLPQRLIRLASPPEARGSSEMSLAFVVNHHDLDEGGLTGGFS